MNFPSGLTVVLLMSVMFHASVVADDGVTFNRDIRAILSENCFQCHGPDAETREAGLRLDLREAAVADRDGSIAINPGDPDASQILERITTPDESLRMPPAESGKTITTEQIELLRRWIAAGAEYQAHWAFEPVQRPQPPTVKSSELVRNPIDQFVLHRLEARGLTLSPAADRVTLIRRVYIDFLGLPPTPEEVDAFVNDESPEAYERLLDRVLISPRYGERWGRHWLDQARYADSHGYTNDNEREIWPYRDWVIDAVNRDLPFDQFTIEQVAGDLLPNPTLDQLIATGFHRNTLINTEGGTKADQFRDEQVKDRIDTTGSVWLGLTVGCAKCHTHKFDPITQAEYYELYAFFNSTADNNSTTPVIKTPSDDQRQQQERLDLRRAELQKQINSDSTRKERQLAWETQLVEAAARQQESQNEAESKWVVLKTQGKSVLGSVLESLEDGSLLATGANVAADEYQVTALAPLTTIRSVRLEALKHDSLPKGGPGRAGNGNFVLSETWFRTSDGRELRYSKALADHSQPDFDVSKAIDNRTDTGWAINGAPEGGPNHNRVAWFTLPRPLEVEMDDVLTFTFQFHNSNSAYNLGRFRLSVMSDEYVDQPTVSELAKLAALPVDKRDKAQQDRLNDAFLRSDPDLSPTYDELLAVNKQRDELLSRIPSTMVMREIDQPRPTHLQLRGDFLRLGESVEPGVPAVLPALKETEQRRTRLDFARWLVRPDHPLTPRVQINRVWMRMFGVGLVETEDDFGTQGTLPSHPELLDWLAVEFVERGWSMKEMLKLIANSSTYRQASAIPEESLGRKLDPLNRLLWRQNRVRVEGEIVRDLSLAVSGLLSDKIGGPSVHPPQPDGVYAFTQRKLRWPTSTGEDRYRRGMYTFFYRSAPYPMLTTFDAPKFNQSCTRRTRSNTPLQSLTVANDETMIEAAQALAARVLTETKVEAAERNDEATLTRMFRLCFARPPRQEERDFLTAFVDGQREHFSENVDAATAVAKRPLPEGVAHAEAASWTATARVLLNLDEFITRE